jgi:ParB-like nuclease domain
VEEPPAVGDEPQPTVWLAIERIAPSPATRNCRRTYDQARLRELADSIREQGILQPATGRCCARWRTSAAWPCSPNAWHGWGC